MYGMDESRWLRLLLFLVLVGRICCNDDDDNNPVKPPTLCEVCKYLTVELKDRLAETGKSKEVIRTGHGIDVEKKHAVAYKKSELRFIEALYEPHVCDKILEYNIHKERKGSLRFAKGRSETMETLHGLVNKGVKVELGIPHDLWDTPSAEVTELQRQCFHMVEQQDEALEDWYFGDQETDLIDYLCRDRVLDKNDQECLEEVFKPKGDKGDSKTKTQPKKSGQKMKKKQKSGNKKGDNADASSNKKTEL